jgi:epoxyqueuosine reductase
MKDFAAQIRDEISCFVARSPANRFPGTDDRFFDDPIVGFAAGDDPVWSDFKQIIGEYHLTPSEVVASYEGLKWLPGSVISWVLPITEKTRKLTRQENLWPSLEWVLTANLGNDFLAELRAHMVEFLLRLGSVAVIPQSVTRRERIDGVEVAVSATWSERHVAYAAGLGTFSLNGGLITERGIAHRCGSIVTQLVLPPTERVHPDHLNNCLFHRQNACGVCMTRCPCGAISKAGKDKVKCFTRLYREVPIVTAKRHGLQPADMKVGSCGLCQTDVPCENQIPFL